MEVIRILTSIPPQDVTQTRGVLRSNVNNPTVVGLNPPKTATALQLFILALNNNCLQQEKHHKRASERDDHSSNDQVRGRTRNRYLLLQFQMEGKKLQKIIAGRRSKIMSSL